MALWTFRGGKLDDLEMAEGIRYHHVSKYPS